MENSFLMLFLHYDVPECPNPRWPPDAILKISFLLFITECCVKGLYIGVFEYGEFISDVFVFNFQVPKYPNPRWPPDAILKIKSFL